MGVDRYSTDPDANGPGGYMPEGQFPSTVNNGVRGIQSDLAYWYNDPGWYFPGGPGRVFTYLGANSYRDPGGNYTSLHLAGRRVRAVGALTGLIHGTIASAAFTGGHTDVQVDWDGSGLQSELPLYIYLSTVPVGPTTWLPVAGTNWRGIIERATDAETLALTDVLRAVTPSNLAALTASTDGRGLVELATVAETQAGTDALRAVTPAALASLDATTSGKGLVELASTGEALDGVLATRALTPASLGGLTIRANPGSIRFPGDLLLQFGSSITDGASFISVTYAALFATFAAPVCSPITALANLQVMVVTSTVTGFTAVVRDNSGNGSGAGIVVTWVSAGF